MAHGETDATLSDHPRGRFTDAATFGAFLQNRRESQNLSLHDVAAETKIAARYLGALEHGDVRSWPGGLYRRAMVRAYATAVGLDPDSTVCDFADAFNEAPAQVLAPEPTRATPAFDDLLNRPHASLCVGLALCAAIAIFTWAVPSSNAGGAIGTNQTRPVPAIGHHDAATTATATSGPPSTPAATFEARPALTTVPPPSTPADEPPAPVDEPTPLDEPPARVDGSMQIMSEPAGAHVTVNGIRSGQTPVTIPYMEPGEKRVRLPRTVRQRRTTTPADAGASDRGGAGESRD